jgi:hypothetical protein
MAGTYVICRKVLVTSKATYFEPGNDEVNYFPDHEHAIFLEPKTNILLKSIEKIERGFGVNIYRGNIEANQWITIHDDRTNLEYAKFKVYVFDMMTSTLGNKKCD